MSGTCQARTTMARRRPRGFVAIILGLMVSGCQTTGSQPPPIEMPRFPENGHLTHVPRHAETSWQRDLEAQSVNEINDVAGLTNGKFAAVGLSAPDGMARFWTAAVDKSNNDVLPESFATPFSEGAYGAGVIATSTTALPDGRWLVGGGDRGNAVLVAYPEGRQPTGIPGKTFKKYDDFPVTVIDDLATTPDGGVVAVGHVRTSWTREHAFIMKLDSNLAIEWRRDIDEGARILNFRGVASLPDGGFVIGGLVARSSQDEDFRPFLALVSNTGKVKSDSCWINS